MPKVVFDYVDGSALDEVSYLRSRNAFNNVEFVAHTLKDVSKIDTSVEILGNKIDLPIFVDSLTNYQSLTSIIEKITIVEDINSSIINLSKYKTRSFFYYYDDTLKDSIDFNSNSWYDKS